jgi:hypothetical protein
MDGDQLQNRIVFAAPMRGSQLLVQPAPQLALTEPAAPIEA